MCQQSSKKIDMPFLGQLLEGSLCPQQKTKLAVQTLPQIIWTNQRYPGSPFSGQMSQIWQQPQTHVRRLHKLSSSTVKLDYIKRCFWCLYVECLYFLYIFQICWTSKSKSLAAAQGLTLCNNYNLPNTRKSVKPH